MTLMISIFAIDEAGQPREPRTVEGSGGLAGLERTRSELWGSRAVVGLGARFLPQLAERDLWVWPDELAAFREECMLLLQRAPELGEATGWDADYIAHRLRNFIAAAVTAKVEGGGVSID